MNPQRGQEGGSAFVYPITVGPDAIDELDHVNNAVYLTWVQQAITAYWVAHAPAEEVAKIAWIALRHDIRYRSEAFLGDLLEAKVLSGAFVVPARNSKYSSAAAACLSPKWTRPCAASTEKHGSCTASRTSWRGISPL